MSTTALKPRPADIPALPKNWVRVLESEPNLNDQVEDIHMGLVADEDYRAFLNAVYDEDAVEGSCSIDQYKAAEMIRARAQKNGNPILAEKKLSVISKSLNVVLRRYGLSRKDRKHTVGGQIVADQND